MVSVLSSDERSGVTFCTFEGRLTLLASFRTLKFASDKKKHMLDFYKYSRRVATTLKPPHNSKNVHVYLICIPLEFRAIELYRVIRLLGCNTLSSILFMIVGRLVQRAHVLYADIYFRLLVDFLLFLF